MRRLHLVSGLSIYQQLTLKRHYVHLPWVTILYQVIAAWNSGTECKWFSNVGINLHRDPDNGRDDLMSPT